jgi:hypothetical protein
MLFRNIHRSTIAALLLFSTLILSVRYSLSQDVTPEPPTSTETPTLELPTLTATASETATETLTPTSSETATATTTSTVISSSETPSALAPVVLPTREETRGVQIEPSPSELTQVLYDGFETNQNWSMGAGWFMDVIDGNYSLTISGSNESAQLVRGDYFDVSAQVKVLIDIGSISLSVRQTVVGAYTVNLSQNGQLTLYRADQILQSTWVTNFDHTTWHILKLTASGSNVSVEIDGILYIYVEDIAPIPPGTVSLRADATSTIYLDDFYLYASVNEVSAIQLMQDQVEINSIDYQEVPLATFLSLNPPGSSSIMAFTRYNTTEAQQDIWILNPANPSIQANVTNTTTISEYNPTISPNGSKLAYHTYGATPGVYVMDTLNNYQVTLIQSNATAPRWSPDSQNLLFYRSGSASQVGLWIRYSNGTLRRIVAQPSNMTLSVADWSPNGNAIVYQWRPFPSDAANPIYNEIAVVAFDATTVSSPVTVVRPLNYWDVEPVWSPSGGTIAFRSFLAGQANTTSADIFVVTVSVSGLTVNLGVAANITSANNLIENAPEYSPDGTQIAFRPDINGIYRMASNGTSPTWMSVANVYRPELSWEASFNYQLPTATPTSTRTPTRTPTQTPPPTATQTVQQQLQAYGVNVTGSWSASELQQLLLGVRATGQAFQSQFGGASYQDAFRRIMFTPTSTRVTFERVSSGNPICVTDTGAAAPDIAIVRCYGSLAFTQYTAVHELGHVFVERTGGYGAGSTYYGLIDIPPLRITSTPGTLVPDPAIRDRNGNVVMGAFVDAQGQPDWVRGRRGWGSAVSTPPAVPCNFQQNGYIAIDATSSQSDRERERDEAAADMFLNWVYSQVGAGGFTNVDWGQITNCTITPTAPAITGTAPAPGDARYNYMETVVFPTLSTRFPTMTPTP